MNNPIAVLDAWEALDSRGRPTVAARIVLADGAEGVALVPSGASAGSHEAVELRDGAARYAGRGVCAAVGNVLALRQHLIGTPATEIDSVLRSLDASAQFATLGANAVLSLSLAATLADAASARVSLARQLAGHTAPLLIPMPMVNIISGGAHAGRALDVQDFLVIPTGASSFAEAIEWAADVRDAATAIAVRQGHREAVLVADEGGLGVPLESNRAALDLLMQAIESSGHAPGSEIAIAIDVAATQLLHDGAYVFARENRTLNATDLVDEFASWCDEYPIVSIEDIVAEDDWSGWEYATRVLGRQVELVGDDLFVTQVDRLQRGIDTGVANSVLVKVNQNGLVSGARSVVELARSAGYRTVVSARSGETEDAWLADLAVGWRAGQIKVGSTHRSERTAKWNRLLQLEATEKTTFAGPWRVGHPAKESV